MVQETLTCASQVTSTADRSDKTGIKIHADATKALLSVTIASGCTATKVYLQTGAGVDIVSANIAGGGASFSSSNTLTSGNDYLIVVDNNGSDYTPKKADPDGGLPYDGSLFNIVADHTGDTGVTRNVQSVTVGDQVTNYTATPSALAISTSLPASTEVIIALPSAIGITATLNGGVFRDIQPSGTITIGTGTIGTRVIDPNYPYDEGLIAGTTKQTGRPNLEVE